MHQIVLLTALSAATGLFGGGRQKGHAVMPARSTYSACAQGNCAGHRAGGTGSDSRPRSSSSHTGTTAHSILVVLLPLAVLLPQRQLLHTPLISTRTRPLQRRFD